MGGWRGIKMAPQKTYNKEDALFLSCHHFYIFNRSFFIAGIMAEVDLWPVTEASSRVWLWKSAIHLHHSKHTNGISPIWPFTLLVFSSGYDVIAASGWKYYSQVKTAKFAAQMNRGVNEANSAKWARWTNLSINCSWKIWWFEAPPLTRKACKEMSSPW